MDKQRILRARAPLDPEHDLVAVIRWIDKASMDGFFARLLSAVER